MLGSVAGDIIGSPFIWNNTSDRYFEMCHSTKGWYNGHDVFYHPKCTGNSVMTLAVARWLMHDESRSSYQLASIMREMALSHEASGFGTAFKRWCTDKGAGPMNSFGNGCATRVSAVGLMADSLSEALSLARQTAEVTHIHPEGIKGAQAIAQAVWMAKHGRSKDEIRFATEQEFGYDLGQDEEDLRYLLLGCTKEPIIVNGEDTGEFFYRQGNRFDTSCQTTVPAAIMAFLKGDSFEDIVRRAVAMGGDSCAVASMAGAIAEPFYKGVPEKIRGLCDNFVSEDLKQVMRTLESTQLHKNLRSGVVQKVPDDSFRVIRVKGQQPFYVVSPYRKELVGALKERFGDDISIISPVNAEKMLKEMTVTRKSGTYLESPRPDVKTLFFQDGEFRSTVTRNGEYLPSRDEREASMRSFIDIHDFALDVKRQLQMAVGYFGEGSIHFESAYFPVVYSSRVEIWRGDCLAGAVGIDPRTGLMKVDAAGDLGPQEHGVARTFSVFTIHEGGSIKDAIAHFCLDEGKGLESKDYRTNISIANEDVAASMDPNLIDSFDTGKKETSETSQHPRFKV